MLSDLATVNELGARGISRKSFYNKLKKKTDPSLADASDSYEPST